MTTRTAALLLIASRALLAQSADPRAVQPERPTVSTHAGSVAPGYIEVESGVELDRFRHDAHAGSGTMVVKLGLASHAQLTIQTAAIRAPGSSLGFGDATVAIKWRLLDHAPILGDFAVLPSLKLATGSVRHGTGTGTDDTGLLLISSHTAGPLSIDVNGGATWSRSDLSSTPRSIWSASVGGPAHGNLGWVAEAFGYPGTSGSTGGPIVALLAGPTLLLQTRLALDAGVIVPLEGSQPHALYAGLVYNAGRLWRGPIR